LVADGIQAATNERHYRPPSASASPEDHADWLELQAFRSRDGNSAIQDLVQEIRRSGTVDALSDTGDVSDVVDARSEKTQAIAQDAFGEVEHRLASCGSGIAQYPFSVFTNYIQRKSRFNSYVYTFLLVLSRYGYDAGPPHIDAADLFERVCAASATEYFGGEKQGVRSYLLASLGG
jgi:hypothetical protein